MSCASRITSPPPIEMSLRVRLVFLYGTVAIGQTAYGDGRIAGNGPVEPPAEAVLYPSVQTVLMNRVLGLKWVSAGKAGAAGALEPWEPSALDGSHAQKGIVKILVVDDHPLMREALRTVLQQLGPPTVVLEAQDCPTALTLAEGHVDLDLILLDLTLPGIHGMDALAVLREKYPELPVVVLSADEGQQTVLQAIERGAMGFIPKSSPREVMLSALRLVMAGGIYLPPTVLQQPVRRAGANSPAASGHRGLRLGPRPTWG
jgi:DNA-binding NarL/FixJ family response regulator